MRQKNQLGQTVLKTILSDKLHMTPEKLDYIFPFIVFFYGLVLLLVLENPRLVRLGEERMGTAFQAMLKHKSFAWICFFVGGLWSIQNVYLTL
jgi:hypothetical protein